MTKDQISALESRLWKAADDLRANSKLTATEYSFPVLGLIFLRRRTEISLRLYNSSVKLK
jgi:type I restriction enzyme M protein